MTARIDFAGDATEPLPLTWGQQAIWAAIGRTAPNDHYFNLDRVLMVPQRKWRRCRSRPRWPPSPP